jgi:hypothetical protein
MTSLVRAVLALVLMLLSTSAFASQTTAQARAVTHSCGYYSTQEVEVGLTYQNANLPWGVSVYLVYGWGGTQSGAPFTWDNTNTLLVSASAPYTWSTTVTSTIAARSSPKFYESITFVWKVVYADGSEFWDKGNTSTWGYYDANFSQVQRPCTSSAGFIGTPTSLVVNSIVKW